MSLDSISSNGNVDDRTPLVASPQNGRLLPSSDSLPGVSPIISESEDSITIRRPVQFHQVNNSTNSSANDDQRTRATINRYKYYNKLAAGSDSVLFMPNHVVPSRFFLVIPIKSEGAKQNSLITIFSIWNTMMGTSLLSMPWAIQQAGFAMGISMIILMAGICLYTAYRVMNSAKQIKNKSDRANPVLEFTDVCHYYLGKPGLYCSIVFSAVSLVGAAIVYWVLMSNFLYNSVNFIYEKANNEFNSSTLIGNHSNTDYADVYCPNGGPLPPTRSPPTTAGIPFMDNETLYFVPQTADLGSSLVDALSSMESSPPDALFHKVWSKTKTVPFFLLLVLGPIINFKSPTFFTKFNALGTVSVVYILIFVIYKAANWGVHVDFQRGTEDFTPQFHWTFPALTGTLSLALYIHNCVMSIVRTQKNPENNGRDLTIAYVCVSMTYLVIGATFYICFPLAKSCIEDNMLNNFTSSDILTFVARIFLFFQMITVFPLLMYIMRIQIMDVLFGSVYPSLLHVVVMNAMVVTVCVLFAVFMPQIGTIIRFSGALCGLVYIFTLPCIIYMLIRRNEGNLTAGLIAFHVVIILLGVLNFIAQFLIM